MPSWLYTNSSVLNANLVCFETEKSLNWMLHSSACETANSETPKCHFGLLKHRILHRTEQGACCKQCLMLLEVADLDWLCCFLK